MTHCGKLLKNYYEKEGNKVVFRNGMNLNQLAMEMWERMEYQGIDASVLSRVIHGKRLLSAKQLQTLCQLLNLSQSAKSELYDSLEKDYLHRHGLTIFSSGRNTIDVLDIFSSQVKKLDFIRERGLLQTTMDWADELADQLKVYADKTTNDIFKDKILVLLAEALFQKGYAAGSIFCPEENIRIVSSIVNQLLKISQVIDSASITAKAYVIQAFAYYALGRYSQGNQYRRFYKKSLWIVKQAVILPQISDQLKLIFLRYTALNNIYLSDKLSFDTAERVIREIISRYQNTSHFSYIVWALDSVARGQSYFYPSKALNTLTQSQSLHRKLKWKDPLRETATIRNELEVFRQIQAKDIAYIRAQAKKGLAIAIDYGIDRYKNYFARCLSV